MLQYITNENSPHSIVEQIKSVIAGGCRWIQIRMKDASDEQIRKVVEEVKQLCIDTETFLLLNDRVDLAKEVNVGGVHVGKDDMPPSKARLLLGPAAVIGVTCNTLSDVLAVKALDIDYIGIGPFADTKTKKNLAPILGLEGVRQLCKEMEDEKIEIPRVVVGGIRLEDVEEILAAGANGIAVSGAIAFSDDMEASTRAFISKLPMTD